MKIIALSFSLLVLSVANAQRGSYAGKRPIENGIKGAFPEQQTNIFNRFGDDNSLNSAPQRLPVDALGNVNLVNQLYSLPPEQRPFWLLNYQVIEAHRNQPQIFAQPFANRGSFAGRR